MTQGSSTGSQENGYHEPVLATEVVEVFKPLTSGVVVDATFGGGGHTRRLLEEMARGISIIGIDRDPDALANVTRLAGPLAGVRVIEGNFRDLRPLLVAEGVEAPVGFLFDLGVSSHQLEEPSRGFSYRREGPLDMRMGDDTDLTADEIVNRWEESRLASLIRRFGEESMAGRIARAIVDARPITTTEH
ncbi:MAG: 16S rRNA (cytosine(1402)-N(4))-methyltransferase RsmH, partial [Acidimicrobiia bacterium]